MTAITAVTTEERWAPWPGDTRYDVSDQGRVRSWAVQGFPAMRREWPWPRRLRTLRDGYRALTLSGNRSPRVHRMVLEAFVGPCPEGMQACHGNGDRADNRLENLRWDTRRGNWADRKQHAEQRRAVTP